MEKPLTDEFYLAAVDHKLAQGKRNTFLAALLSVLCIGIGCGLIYYQGLQLQAVRLCGFLLLGFVFATAMGKKAAAHYPFLPALLIAFTIQLCVLAFSIATDRLEGRSNIAYAAAFFLPVVLTQAWYLFQAISRSGPVIWYASGKMPPEPPFVYFDNRRIRIKVIREGEEAVMLSTAAPNEMKLGMAFYYAASERNNHGNAPQIQFTKENGQPHAWVFYLRSFGWFRRYLNAEETIFDNYVSPNTLVIAERIG